MEGDERDKLERGGIERAVARRIHIGVFRMRKELSGEQYNTCAEKQINRMTWH